MFTACKDQYYENDHSPKSNLQAQCNSNQSSYNTLNREKKEERKKKRKKMLKSYETTEDP